MTAPSGVDGTGPPAWPALAGRFGAVLGLVWLVDPAAVRGGLPALAALSLVAGSYGVCRHLVAADVRPAVEGPADR